MGADGTMEKGTPKDGRRMIGGKGKEHERRDREGTEGAGDIEVIGAGKGMGRGGAMQCDGSGTEGGGAREEGGGGQWGRSGAEALRERARREKEG